MRYLSVCSGIEAATVAWHPLGWRAYCYSEIDAFPSAVLKHHYPCTPNLGDMAKFMEWPDADIDLLVGGTPCQSFSIAGFRKGLADPRGNLMLIYLAIASRYRPNWLVWENVPGVLSSSEGRDFGAFVWALGQLGYGWAYRSLDAQYFNLAQRRERVFVVASSRGWASAAAVLFEHASLRWDPPPERETREDPTQRPGASAEGEGNRLVAHTLRAEGFDASEDGTGRGIPLVSVALGFDSKGFSSSVGEVTPTLRAMNHADSHPNAGGQLAVTIGTSVRRLTPIECERLQGFPDNYTLITYRGKPAKDSPRYKALGNSMAVPTMRWIGRRIAAVEAITQQRAA